VELHCYLQKCWNLMKVCSLLGKTYTGTRLMSQDTTTVVSLLAFISERALHIMSLNLIEGELSNRTFKYSLSVLWKGKITVFHLN
jgi:hypothetical protein